MRLILKDEHIYGFFSKWKPSGLNNVKFTSNVIRLGVQMENPSHEVRQYDVLQKLKNMQARGLLTAVPNGNHASATLWMVSEDNRNGK